MHHHARERILPKTRGGQCASGPDARRRSRYGIPRCCPARFASGFETVRSDRVLHDRNDRALRSRPPELFAASENRVSSATCPDRPKLTAYANIVAGKVARPPKSPRVRPRQIPATKDRGPPKEERVRRGEGIPWRASLRRGRDCALARCQRCISNTPSELSPNAAAFSSLGNPPRLARSKHRPRPRALCRPSV